MASARTLTTNELGAARFQTAQAAGLWPVEVRLHPLPHDVTDTVYTLHTPGNDPVAFSHTPRHELRATLAVIPGALVYEVLRDGVLISTGGIDVRPPESPLQRSQFATPLDRRPPSGARQLATTEEDLQDDTDGWAVRFEYEEMTWMAKEVDVVTADTGQLLASLVRQDSAFVAVAYVRPGTLRYRFRVIPYEGLSARTAPVTRLGWDDGATRHAWELMTWPLELGVSDLSESGAAPGAAHVEVADDEATSTGAVDGDMRDDEADHDDDDDDDDDDGELGEETETTTDSEVRMKGKEMEAENFGESVVQTDVGKNMQEDASFGTGQPDGGAKDVVRNPCGKDGDSGPGVGCFVMAAAMFLLGSSVTIWLGSRKMDDDEFGDEERDGSTKAQTSDGDLLRYQRGVSF